VLRRSVESAIEKWQSLFGDAGLVQIKTVDKSDLMARWMRDSRKQLGLPGHLALAFKIIRQWGIQGLRRIIQSERVFSSGFLGYAIVVGTRR